MQDIDLWLFDLKKWSELQILWPVAYHFRMSRSFYSCVNKRNRTDGRARKYRVQCSVDEDDDDD